MVGSISIASGAFMLGGGLAEIFGVGKWLVSSSSNEVVCSEAEIALSDCVGVLGRWESPFT
jgi:hypothetical protein